MASYLDRWKTIFPKVVGSEARPTDGIDNSLDFNTDGFPQRIVSDPVHYSLENALGEQLFSNDQRLKELITTLSNTIWDKIYPVGSYYWRNDNTSPATLFGGTWEQVKDKFILAAGDTYSVGNIGGEATHTLSITEIPAHKHTGTTDTTGEHTHYSVGREGGCLRGLADTDTDNGNNLPTSSAGAHYHTLNVDNTGGGEAHNNMPPYVVAFCWKRTA